MAAVVSFDDLPTAIKQQLSSPLDEWSMPWDNGIVEPYNPISGHTYSGNNAVTLLILLLHMALKASSGLRRGQVD